MGDKIEGFPQKSVAISYSKKEFYKEVINKTKEDLYKFKELNKIFNKNGYELDNLIIDSIDKQNKTLKDVEDILKIAKENNIKQGPLFILFNFKENVNFDKYDILIDLIKNGKGEGDQFYKNVLYKTGYLYYPREDKNIFTPMEAEKESVKNPEFSKFFGFPEKLEYYNISKLPKINLGKTGTSMGFSIFGEAFVTDINKIENPEIYKSTIFNELTHKYLRSVYGFTTDGEIIKTSMIGTGVDFEVDDWGIHEFLSTIGSLLVYKERLYIEIRKALTGGYLHIQNGQIYIEEKENRHKGYDYINAFIIKKLNEYIKKGDIILPADYEKGRLKQEDVLKILMEIRSQMIKNKSIYNDLEGKILLQGEQFIKLIQKNARTKARGHIESNK